MVRMNDGNDCHKAEQIFELGALLTTEELHAAAETVMAAIMPDGSSHWTPRWQGCAKSCYQRSADMTAMKMRIPGCLSVRVPTKQERIATNRPHRNEWNIFWTERCNFHKFRN